MMRAAPGTVAAAALLPPLGVYRLHGAERDFAIACGLTALGFLPGMAFALWTAFGRPGLTRNSSATPESEVPDRTDAA